MQLSDQLVHQVRIKSIEQVVVERRPMSSQTGEESGNMLHNRIAVRIKTLTRELSTPCQIGLGETGILLKYRFQYTKPNLDGFGVTKQHVGGQFVVDRPQTVELVHGDIKYVFFVACVP